MLRGFDVTSLVILGAGGMAREAYAYAISCGVEGVVFVDETIPDRSTLKIGTRSSLVINDWNAFTRDASLRSFRQFVVGVGDPGLKRHLVGKALQAGLEAAPTLIHDHAHVYGEDCVIGRGGILAPGCRLTTNIRLGDYVLLGINCAIGHDTIIGDYVSCYPGCQVSGNVTLGSGALLGTGTCVREKLTIADNVTAGAQSCIVKSIFDSGITVAGVPARRLNRTDSGTK